MKEEIIQIRQKINEIDQEMARLFEQRMEEAKKIALYKIENALPIEDKNREKELIQKNSSLIKNLEIQAYYLDFLKNMITLSKRYQSKIMEGMKIAYCGVEGAFSYIASKKIFENQKTISFSSFTLAYQAVENGECDACILPLENSYAGDVGEVMDLLFSGTLYINHILNIDIVHNLIGLKHSSLEKIQTVASHPQALTQCKEYIEKHHYKTLEFPNTAIAAKKLSEMNDESIAVIASKDVVPLYDLKLLKSNINSNKSNTTRFAVFSKVLNELHFDVKMGEHFILVFTVLNEAGALAKTLNIIGAHGFNMRTLRSRPMKELLWNYYFFVELDGNIYSQDGQDMIKELKSVCDCLKIVGTYYSHIER